MRRSRLTSYRSSFTPPNSMRLGASDGGKSVFQRPRFPGLAQDVDTIEPLREVVWVILAHF